MMMGSTRKNLLLYGLLLSWFYLNIFVSGYIGRGTIFRRWTQRMVSQNPSENTNQGVQINIPRQLIVGTPKNQYDLLSKLLKERTIIVGQEITNEMANIIVAELLHLDGASGDPITMYINCAGGSIPATFAILDTMQFLNCPIETICMGSASSLGAFLLAAGTKGHRKSFPNSRIMLQYPIDEFEGEASELDIAAKVMEHSRDMITTYISLFTNQPKEKVFKDLERDLYLTPQDALTYGLIDEIIPTKKMLSPKQGASLEVKPPLPIFEEDEVEGKHHPLESSFASGFSPETVAEPKSFKISSKEQSTIDASIDTVFASEPEEPVIINSQEPAIKEYDAQEEISTLDKKPMKKSKSSKKETVKGKRADADGEISTAADIQEEVSKVNAIQNIEEPNIEEQIESIRHESKESLIYHDVTSSTSSLDTELDQPKKKTKSAKKLKEEKVTEEPMMDDEDSESNVEKRKKKKTKKRTEEVVEDKEEEPKFEERVETTRGEESTESVVHSKEIASPSSPVDTEVDQPKKKPKASKKSKEDKIAMPEETSESLLQKDDSESKAEKRIKKKSKKHTEEAVSQQEELHVEVFKVEGNLKEEDSSKTIREESKELGDVENTDADTEEKDSSKKKQKTVKKIKAEKAVKPEKIQESVVHDEEDSESKVEKGKKKKIKKHLEEVEEVVPLEVAPHDEVEKVDRKVKKLIGKKRKQDGEQWPTENIHIQPISEDISEIVAEEKRKSSKSTKTTKASSADQRSMSSQATVHTDNVGKKKRGATAAVIEEPSPVKVTKRTSTKVVTEEDEPVPDKKEVKKKERKQKEKSVVGS